MSLHFSLLPPNLPDIPMTHLLGEPVDYVKPLSNLVLVSAQPWGPAILLAGTGVTAVGLVWEHIARTRGSEFKPSVGIKWLANHSVNFFSLVGSFLGKISSYLYHMDLKGIKDTLIDFFSPILHLMASPLGAAHGYYAYAKQFIGGEGFIYIGSVLLLIMVYALGPGVHGAKIGGSICPYLLLKKLS